MLSQNSPGGMAQFFDRDAPAEMAKIAMEGMQEFMVKFRTISTGILDAARTRPRPDLQVISPK